MKIRKTTIYLITALFLTVGIASGFNLITMAGGGGSAGWVDAFTDTNGVRLDAHTPTGTPEMGPSSITSSTGTISGNAARHTETTGAELVTNGNMELDSEWVDQGTPTTNERSSEQKNGGSFSWKFTADSANDGIKSSTKFSVTEGKIYKLSYAIYCDDNTGYQSLTTDGFGFDPLSNFRTGTIDAWEVKTEHFLASETNSNLFVIFAEDGAGTGTFYVDDVSIKEVTPSSINSMVNLGVSEIVAEIVIKAAAAGEWASAWILSDDLSDPNNGVNCRVDRTIGNLVCFERVAGTDTELLSEAVTFNAGDTMILVFDSGVLTVFFDDLLVGTPQAIDSALWNFPNAGFSTTGAATIESVSFKPLTFGPELLSNHDFSTWVGDDPVDWDVDTEDGSNFVTELNNNARMVSDNSATLKAVGLFATTAGELYRFVFMKTAHANGFIRWGLEEFGEVTIKATSNIGGSDSNGTYIQYYVMPNNENVRLEWFRDIVGGGLTDFEMISISAKQVQ